MKHKKGYLNEHLGIIIMLTMSNVTRLVNNVHYMPSVVKFPNEVLTNYISFLLLCFNDILAHHMMINSNIYFFRWLADDSAQVCPLCSQKFTQIRRKHHCRQCGKVLCSKCCNEKVTQLTVNFIPVII